MHWNGEIRRNPFGGLDCDELLKTLDFVTVTYMHRAKATPVICRGGELHDGPFNKIRFPKGCHWLWLCSSNLSWAPALIQLRHSGFAVAVTRGQDFHGRVHFPQEFCSHRSDLDYGEIDALFTQLGQSAEVAHEMLERLQGNFTNSFAPYDGFIDAVIVLMFGVDAGRNYSTTTTSLMLLELVAGKRISAEPCNTPFTLGHAFRCGSPKRSLAAIREELNIMRHWLDATEHLSQYNQLSVKGRILQLLRTYLG